jgi:hypothetical protein
MNFAIVGYAYSFGNVMLDDALPLEDTDSRLHSITLAYARSISVFGLSGRVSAVVPLANGKWTGEVEGVDTSATRNGLGDPLFGLAVNFIGSPALRRAEFASYRRKTIIGASLKVRPPLGQYNSSKFFNLSSGRWYVSPRLGIMQYLGRFVLEGYVSGWFFTANDDFYGGNRVEQDPLLALQLHFIYRFRRGFWGALSFGQSFGGETKLNGARQDNSQSNNRLGATIAIPVEGLHALKATYASGVSTRAGANFDTFAIAWQYGWGGK